MPTAEAWQAFAGVAGVIVFLGGVVFALQRLGLVNKKSAPAPAPPASTHPSDLERRITAIEHALEQNYISRGDWIPIASRMMGLMERNTEMLARLDERTRSQ